MSSSPYPTHCRPVLCRKTVLALATVCSLFIGNSALAGPMGFKDSTMFMGDFSSNWREASANYAVTPRDALGMSTLYMRNDDKTLTREMAELTYTRLLKRWNFPSAQLNIWLPVGAGEIRGNDFSDRRTVFTPGLQMDFETQRIYFATNYRAYRAEDINHDFSSVRSGFSFYETGYNETQPWLIVEARRMHDLSDETEITPMLRFINKRYFVELGYSSTDEARFNIMYIF
ncbi:MAG TPA: hypothetical protein VLB90_08005 [Pseudomonadales bacterium]|nr:hypothetical protein [Pseudomonadales bacterium]